MPTVMDKDIFGLEVPVHDSDRVKILKRGEDLGGVEFRVLNIGEGIRYRPYEGEIRTVFMPNPFG